GDETGVAVGGGCSSSGIGVVSRDGVCAAPEGEGAAGATASARFFFFLGRSVFPPPNKLLIILLRSRPTSLSIRFVPGRPIVPPKVTVPDAERRIFGVRKISASIVISPGLTRYLASACSR